MSALASGARRTETCGVGSLCPSRSPAGFTHDQATERELAIWDWEGNAVADAATNAAAARRLPTGDRVRRAAMGMSQARPWRARASRARSAHTHAHTDAPHTRRAGATGIAKSGSLRPGATREALRRNESYRGR